MKTSFDAAGKDPLLASLEREREKERRAPDELWALTLTQTLVAELPQLTAAPADEASAPRPAALDPRRPTADGRELEGSGSSGPDAPATLSAEVSDERLGRLRVVVERLEGGLDIVINVADSRVKALIEAERGQLMKTLKDAGLHVASVQIGRASRAGTALAQDRGGAEKVRSNAGAPKPPPRGRTYHVPPSDDGDADDEGVDKTA